MMVSYNELQALSRKAFLGIGFSEAQADDAADTVCWMESHELNGLVELNQALQRILAEDNRDKSPELLYQDADLAIIDGHDMSVLQCSHLPLELAFAKARARGLGVLKIRHCRQRQLIMGYLARLASRGMNITALWRHAQTPLTEQVVGFRANSTVPSIRIYTLEEIPDENKLNTGITVIMANHVDLLPTMRSDYSYDLLARHEESELLEVEVRRRASGDGFDVPSSLWDQLKTLAQRTFVESFEGSQLGAGPLD